MSKPFFNKAVIIGVGQIGASIGMNLVSRRRARVVIGVGPSKGNLREAVRLRAIHRYLKSSQAQRLLRRLGPGDLVILATPAEGIVRYLNILPDAPLVMDVGSAKAKIVRAAQRRRLRFIGCHPIAGTEKEGAVAGRRDLFRKRLCLISPAPFSKKGDLDAVTRLWRKMGSQVIVMDADRHDRLLAAVSHLPHVAAYSLIRAVSRLVRFPREGRFAFEGLKGTTRIAGSPAEMWRDIFLQNRKEVLRALGSYLKELARLRSFIAKGKRGALLNYLRRSQKIRGSL